MPIPKRPQCTGYVDTNELHHECDKLAMFSVWSETNGVDESVHKCSDCFTSTWGI